MIQEAKELIDRLKQIKPRGEMSREELQQA
jgi:hypothetical protein